MNKIDTHVHVAKAKTPSRGGDPRHPEQHYIADPHELRPHLERQGITKAILMSSGETYGPIGCANNEECQEIVLAEPDFFAWMCNFDAKEPETVLARMDNCKKQGAVGVGELMINEWMDSPMLTAIFAAAEKLHLPVTFHMSPEPGFSYGICDHPGLQLLEQTLRNYPELILVGHSQTFWLEISTDCPKEGLRERNGFGKGPVIPGGRVETLMATYPNLYADLSAYSGSCAIMRDEAYGLAFLETFQDRLFFATDTLNSCQTFPLGKFLQESVDKGRLSVVAYEKICYKNAQNIYGI